MTVYHSSSCQLAIAIPLASSRFYSVSSSLHRLLRLLATEVTVKAKEIVGSDPLISPGEVCMGVLCVCGEACMKVGGVWRCVCVNVWLCWYGLCLTNYSHYYAQSLVNLKQALRVCAAFRGCYLDYREKAEGIVRSQHEAPQHGEEQAA